MKIDPVKNGDDVSHTATQNWSVSGGSSYLTSNEPGDADDKQHVCEELPDDVTRDGSVTLHAVNLKNTR